MKKVRIKVLLFLMLAGLIFVSCNNSGQSEGAMDFTIDEDEEIVLTISIEGSGYNLENLIALFERDHPNIKVALTAYDYETDKYNEQINTGIMSGTVDDIFSIDKSYYAKYFNGDYVEDLNLYINQDPSVSAGDYYEQVLKAMEYKGHLYAFPFNYFYYLAGVHEDFAGRLTPDFSSMPGVSYRDMMDMYINLEDTGGRQFILGFGPGRAVVMDDYVDVENKTSHIDSEAFRTLIEDAKALSNTEWPDILFNTSIYYTREAMDVYAETFLFHVIYNNICLQAMWPDTEPYTGFEQPPTLYYTDYKPIMNINNQIDYYVTDTYAISAASENKAAAWAFLKYITSPGPLEESGNIRYNMYVSREANRQALQMQLEEAFRMGINDFERPLTEEENAVIGDIVDRYEAFNELPMNLAKYIRGNDFHETLTKYQNDELTLDQAVTELHNRAALNLAE